MIEPITVIIADDHPLFRRGLLEVLEPDGAFQIIAEAGNGSDALALIERHHPHIALLDISMPVLSGLDVAERMQALRLPSAAVLLTMYRETAVFRRALDAGVRGYVLKDSAVIEIVACLHTVAAGRAYISPALSTELLTHHANQSSPTVLAIGSLTAAERPILQLIARGHTSSEIAASLNKSVKTIENHRSHICQKLGLTGPQALLRFALENKAILAD